MGKSTKKGSAQKNGSLMASAHLLELMSAGGDAFGKHSPCQFCRHRGKETCPYGMVQKFEPCPDYTARHRSKVLEKKIIIYLQSPPEPQQLRLIAA